MVNDADAVGTAADLTLSHSVYLKKQRENGLTPRTRKCASSKCGATHNAPSEQCVGGRVVRRWVCAVNRGTIASGVFAAFAYLYMAASWGAYVFISNLIPLYIIIMFFIGRCGRREDSTAAALAAGGRGQREARQRGPGAGRVYAGCWGCASVFGTAPGGVTQKSTLPGNCLTLQLPCPAVPPGPVVVALICLSPKCAHRCTHMCTRVHTQVLPAPLCGLHHLLGGGRHPGHAGGGGHRPGWAPCRPRTVLVWGTSSSRRVGAGDGAGALALLRLGVRRPCTHGATCCTRPLAPTITDIIYGNCSCLQPRLLAAAPAAAQIRFIGFNHVLSNELLSWNAVFAALQVRDRAGGAVHGEPGGLVEGRGLHRRWPVTQGSFSRLGGLAESRRGNCCCAQNVLRAGPKDGRNGHLACPPHSASYRT